MPSSTPKSLLKQIKSHLSKSDYSSPLPILKSLLKQQPQSIVAYLYLGFCFWKLGDLTKSDIAFDKARELLREEQNAENHHEENTNEKELGALRGEILRGHLEVVLQMEAESQVADVVIRPKKHDIYTDILKYGLLPRDDGSYANWWRIHVDMYVKLAHTVPVPEDCSDTVYDVRQPLERGNLEERVSALRRMIQLWHKNAQVAQETPLVNRASAKGSAGSIQQQPQTLQRFIIVQNLLEALQQKEDKDIDKQTEERIVQFIDEKTEDAFQKIMKKRKCSRGEAKMLLYGQVFATEDEKAQEAARYKSQLHKNIVFENQEWDTLFEDYQQTMRDAQQGIHKALYLRYLKRRYAQYCHKHAPPASPVSDLDSEEKSKSTTKSSSSSFETDFSQLVQICAHMLAQYQVEFYPMKLLIFLRESSQWRDEYLSAEFTANTSTDVYFQRICTKLLTFYPYKGISQAILSKQMIDTDYAQHHIDQVDSFIQESIQQQCPMYIQAWTPYARLWYTMDKFKLSAQLARMGLEKIEQRHSAEGLTFSQHEQDLNGILCDALYASGQLDESESIAKDLLRQDKNNISALKALGRVTLAKGNLLLAAKLYERSLSLNQKDASAHCELGWILHLQGENAKSEQHLKAALNLNSRDYLVHYRLGRVYWDMDEDYRTNKEFAYASFLQSAKLNPRLSSNFAYLGHYYFTIEKDIPRAQKCYQKAVTLNPLEQEAGENLATIYQSKQQDDLAVALFQEVTEKNSRAHWAWKRLGFHQQVSGEFDAALKSFQFALRANATDPMTWEGLAETYHRQGKYLAASKAYSRCFELDKSSVYALSQIGVVSNLLGELNDAYITFQSVIETDPDFVLGYTGLSEALFDKAKEYYGSGILVTAAQHLLGALTVLNVFVKKNDNYKAVWKMLGDVSCMFFLLSNEIISDANDKMSPDALLFVSFPQVVSDNFQCISKSDALAQASTAFSHLTKLNPHFADHHFDLGVSFAYQYFTRLADDNATAGDTAKLCESAIASVHEAIRLQPNQWTYWNVLGCVVPDDHLKQHCFIKAIQKNSKSSIPWNNLGALYMKHSQFQLAQKAFSNAQNLSPKDSISWLGLAILSERRLFEDDAQKFNEETLTRAQSAYTFSWSLKNSLAASLGFAYTSFFHQDYQETCHAIVKYLQLDEENPIAWNVFGVSLESLGKFEQARNILKIALEKAEKQMSGSQQGDTSNNTHITVHVKESSLSKDSSMMGGVNVVHSITVNLVRVLCQLRQFQEASDLINSSGDKNGDLNLFAARIALESQSSAQAHKAIQSFNIQESTVHLLLALAHVREKKWRQGESSVANYLESHSSDVNAHQFLSLLQCLSDGGSCDRAVEYLSGVSLSVLQHGVRMPQIQQLHLHMASLLLAQSQPEQSLVHCSRALRLDPTNHKVILIMLRCVTHPQYLDSSADASKLAVIHGLCNQAWESHVAVMLGKCKHNQADAVETYILLGYGLLLVGSTHGNQVKIASRTHNAALNALRIDPSCQRALLLLIASASVRNGIGNAIDLIQMYLQSEQTGEEMKVFLLELLCQQFVMAEQSDKCIETVDKHVGNLKSPLHKARLLSLQSMAQSIVGDASFKSTLMEALKFAGNNVDLHLVAGVILMKENQFEEADQLLQKTISGHKPEEGVSSSGAFALSALKAFSMISLLENAKGTQKSQLAQDASRLCRALVDFNNMSGLAHFLFGVTKFKEGDMKEAERQLLDAQMREPNLFFVNQYLYELYYSQGRWEESERHLIRESHLRRHDANLLYWLADFAFQSQHKEKALDYANRALSLDAEHVEALHLKKTLEQKEKKQKQQAVRRRR